MYWFLVPMAAGFACNWASAFTRLLHERLKEPWGQRTGFVLRNVLGIPLWVAGILMACRQPAPLIFVPGRTVILVSWLLLLLGTVAMLFGLARLRMRAYRPTRRDTLVSDGIFRFIRHPIYSGLLADFVALALQRPARPVLLACFLGWFYVQVQARLEEIDLKKRIPGYDDYMEIVPRFFPGLRSGKH
jgi:protein-S-isoprenylcysteine O-methyltransferase Ste14